MKSRAYSSTNFSGRSIQLHTHLSHYYVYSWVCYNPRVRRDPFTLGALVLLNNMVEDCEPDDLPLFLQRHVEMCAPDYGQRLLWKFTICFCNQSFVGKRAAELLNVATAFMLYGAPIFKDVKWINGSHLVRSITIVCLRSMCSSPKDEESYAPLTAIMGLRILA